MNSVPLAIGHSAVVSFFLLLAPLSSAQPASESPEVISVRIQRSDRAILLSGFGIVLNHSDHRLGDPILPVRKELAIRYKDNKWIVDQTKGSRYHLEIPDHELKISGEMLRINRKLVSLNAGSEIRLVREGDRHRLDVIVDMPLEEYLKGVLPSEMSPKWPLEALKAQAVAARTYAKNLMRENSHRLFHLDNTNNNQVYLMENYQKATRSVQEKIDRSLNETRGIFLSDENGNAYPAYYHSDCGGQTEEPQQVWPEIVSKNGTVRDQRCAVNPLSVWHYEIPLEKIENKIVQLFNLKNAGRLMAITIDSYTPSGRVQKLKFKFSNGGESELNGQDFRKIFGYDSVRSTLFRFEIKNFAMVLSGRGHGHGVGLCQKGAYFMSLAGAKYAEILRRYYPKSRMSRPHYFMSEKVQAGLVKAQVNANKAPEASVSK